MRKTKVVFILFLVLFMVITPFTKVNAHTVELDSEGLISFPWTITNGKGTITIDDEITNYELYYQSLQIPDDDYAQIETITENGETALDNIDAELDVLRAEKDNLKTIYDEAYDAYLAKAEDETATAEEVETARVAYETAKTNYENKLAEYNSKASEYNAKVEEMYNGIHALIPMYVDTNWTKTEDGSFAIDLTQFSGDRSVALWAKLVCSDGTIAYDVTYTVASGTKVETIAVQAITLDKAELTLAEGSSYTLIPTISPENATNKSIIWTSEDENIAKVEDGKVTAIAEGTTTITATTNDGQHTATCEVTVTKKAVTTPEEEKDPTVADEIIPAAGSLTYILIIAILGLSVLGMIMHKKVKYLNFK